MSHTTLEFTSPETPLPDRRVGELVAERPGRSRVFQAHKLDFCCQGNRTVREACERKGVSLETLIEELEREAAEPSAPKENPAELSPEKLCAYIVENHHGYLVQELPRLHAMAARVAHVHGGHTASLVEVYQVVDAMEQELSRHMQKEEQILFPAIEAMSGGGGVPGPVDGPIRVMMREHDETGDALTRLRELTNGFEPPADACNTYRALFAGLAELEEDLQRHIHLENSVLFPAARDMAGTSAEGAGRA